MSAPYSKNNVKYWREWNKRIREEVKGSLNNNVPHPYNAYPVEKLSGKYEFQYVNNVSGSVLEAAE